MTVPIALAHLAGRIETLAKPSSVARALGDRFRHDKRAGDEAVAAPRHFSFRIVESALRGNSARGNGRYERFDIELRIEYPSQTDLFDLTHTMADDVGKIGDVIFDSANWAYDETGIRLVGGEGNIARTTFEKSQNGYRALMRFLLEVTR